jgi:hypothetical protein
MAEMSAVNRRPVLDRLIGSSFMRTVFDVTCNNEEGYAPILIDL